jgi:hypothetical protein
MICVLEDDHDGAHNDPEYGPWFSTERALLADMRGDDFPCCGPGGHGYGRGENLRPVGVDLRTGNIVFTRQTANDMAARQALKRARLARRPVTKT